MKPTRVRVKGKKQRVANEIVKIKLQIQNIDKEDPFRRFAQDNQDEDDGRLIKYIMDCLTIAPKVDFKIKNGQPKKERGFFDEDDDEPKNTLLAKSGETDYFLLLLFKPRISRTRYLSWILHFDRLQQVILCEILLDCQKGDIFEDFVKKEPCLLEKWILLEAKKLELLNKTKEGIPPMVDIEIPPLHQQQYTSMEQKTVFPQLLGDGEGQEDDDDDDEIEIVCDGRVFKLMDVVLKVLKDPDNQKIRAYFMRRLGDVKFSQINPQDLPPKASIFELNDLQRKKLQTTEFDLNFPYRYNYDYVCNITKNSVVVLDCEFAEFSDNAEGENAQKKAISISVFNYQGDVLINKLFRPSGYIKHPQTGVHGFTLEDIKAADPVGLVKNYLENLLHGTIVVGYALKNDLDALQAAGFDFKPSKAIDIQAFKEFWRATGSPVGLAKLVQEVWKRKLPPHKALADSRATLYLFKLFEDNIMKDPFCLLEYDEEKKSYIAKKYFNKFDHDLYYDDEFYRASR